MQKDDNDWSIYINRDFVWTVEMNGTKYTVDKSAAAICHAILLLVDAVNDKKI